MTLKQEIKDLRAKVDHAFQTLRNEGYVAKENFQCCTTCASHGVREEASEKNLPGGLYWHEQDEESFAKTGVLAIGFTVSEVTALTNLGEKVLQGKTPDELRLPENVDTVEAVHKAVDCECERLATIMAKRAAALFTEQGIEVEWEESVGRKIILYTPSAWKKQKAWKEKMSAIRYEDHQCP